MQRPLSLLWVMLGLALCCIPSCCPHHLLFLSPLQEEVTDRRREAEVGYTHSHLTLRSKGSVHVLLVLEARAGAPMRKHKS